MKKGKKKKISPQDLFSNPGRDGKKPRQRTAAHPLLPKNTRRGFLVKKGGKKRAVQKKKEKKSARNAENPLHLWNGAREKKKRLIRGSRNQGGQRPVTSKNEKRVEQMTPLEL